MLSIRCSSHTAVAALQSSFLILRTMATTLPCTTAAIPFPSLPGAEVLSVTAFQVKNYESNITAPANNYYAEDIRDVDFCNVTVTYTHPGEGDTINANFWLPSKWNGRFMGNGGGGFATGALESSLALAVSRGFAAGGTDGGHVDDPYNAYTWADISPGNVNLYLLQDFASVALNDMTILGKQLSETFYGQAPKYSYWNGCSTGGRQGLMMAQRYPAAYDGIVAASPAINWAKFVVAGLWPQFTMRQLNYYPSPCEFEALQAAAIRACDGLDGVTDGIIARPDLCKFDPHSVVGERFPCLEGTTTTITSKGAKVAQAIWKGMVGTTGDLLWYGLNPGSPFSDIAATSCSNGVCESVPFSISEQWVTLFVEKNSTFDTSNLTLQQFVNVFHESIQQFTSIISTDDPDLSAFQRAGGRMITWHGLADQLIFPQGTVNYYSRVQGLNPDIRSFYRFYEAPGVNHCGGGLGAFPGNVVDQLIDWVEHGKAPDTLNAQGTGKDGRTKSLNLCQWPLVPQYRKGDPNDAKSYVCSERKVSVVNL
ncbi:Tannase/feruloyl esterase [Xylogone sp. PMI_703]|nr:Tannase/feruloyl esterase [Xylogone sp. PMI_703]